MSDKSTQNARDSMDSAKLVESANPNPVDSATNGVDSTNITDSTHTANATKATDSGTQSTDFAHAAKPKDSEQEPKYGEILKGLKDLTLGISMIVAILIGVGIGAFLRNLFGVAWVFWLGVAMGVCAAILNVYKAYKAQMKSFDELARDPKYRHNQCES